jgi:hypothetical protein
MATAAPLPDSQKASQAGFLVVAAAHLAGAKSTGVSRSDPSHNLTRSKPIDVLCASHDLSQMVKIQPIAADRPVTVAARPIHLVQNSFLFRNVSRSALWLSRHASHSSAKALGISRECPNDNARTASRRRQNEANIFRPRRR